MLGDALRRPTWVSLAAGVVPVAMHFLRFCIHGMNCNEMDFFSGTSVKAKKCVGFFTLSAAMRPQFNAFLRADRAKQRRMAGTH
ncbi:Uncharacterised protein [Salmonella enterica subsp. enterica]|uniref:Uncharacterized protein n=1 Tax=Salmonella enterica I TaxID=59201 RepID=A0A447TY28_SALET|nr:Uncharacterised protein [Salmonella enterica subsp. enterica]